MPAVAFRPFVRADLPLLAWWLADPVVARWWHHDPHAVEADFGPSVDGGDATALFAVLLDGRAVGLVQRYAIAAYPEWAAELAPLVDVPAGALGIDYLLGPADVRGRGVGTAMIVGFTHESFAAYPDAPAIVVPVPVGNTASWRALAAAGFRRVTTGPLTPDNPIDPPDHHVYRLDRPT